MVGEDYKKQGEKAKYYSALYEMTLDGSGCHQLPMAVGADWAIRQVRVDPQGECWILYSYRTDTAKSAYQVHTIIGLSPVIYE